MVAHYVPRKMPQLSIKIATGKYKRKRLEPTVEKGNGKPFASLRRIEPPLQSFKSLMLNLANSQVV